MPINCSSRFWFTFTTWW